MDFKNLNLPPLDVDTIQKNAQEFLRKNGKLKDKSWDGLVGEKETQVVVVIADVYVTYLRHLREKRRLEQKDLNGIQISIGYLRKMLKASKKDVKKRLLRLESTGAIRIENETKEGIRVWPSLFPIFKSPESFEEFVTQIEEKDNSQS